jgi:GNAT superfamily N-acetyltransferase
MAIQVRRAALDDTSPISAVFRSHITIWQRVNPQAQVEDVPYETLTVYERWLHGGAWMSAETAAIHLNHLLLGAGIPLVAEQNGQIRAYAEAYRGVEPMPYGDHLHLAHLTVMADQVGKGFEDALMAATLELAQASKYKRVTAACIGNDPNAEALYRQQGLSPMSHLQRLSLPAKSGQGFYKALEHLNPNPAQIHDWFMPLGRYGSARQQWETLWPRQFDTLPDVAARRTQRIHLSAAGQEAFVCCQQGLYAPRNADIYLWSPKPLTSQLLTAIRDWTHREGYRTLTLFAADETVPVLGGEAEADGYTQSVYGVAV